MTVESEPYVNKFRPLCLADIAGNKSAIYHLRKWVQSWEKGIPKLKAAFLHGPPGVGKTCSVVALAKDMDYDLLEVNASDYRTKKRLEELVGRAILQKVTITGRKRMILFDEMEGISGHQDRGGTSSIASLIKGTRIPIILVATSIGEKWEEKFRPLVNLSLIIEYHPIPFADMIQRLHACVEELGISVDVDVLEYLAEHSEGDLRSTLNDLETMTRGKNRVTIEDVDCLSYRDRKNYIPDALMKMFAAKSLRDARGIISNSHLRYEDIFDWIYENLPLVLNDPNDLSSGMEALAIADIYENRAKSTQEYRLLKYMFNAMTGGVALAKTSSDGFGLVYQVRRKIATLGFSPTTFTIIETFNGLEIKPVRYLGKEWRRVNSALVNVGARWARGEGKWLLPYLRPPQLLWRYRRTWHSRRRRRSIAERVAERCHISRQEAITEVLPLLKVMFQTDKNMAEDLTKFLELEDKEAEWLKS